MATYEEIYGKRVKDFDSDPTLESSYEGQVWYDKSTGVLKSVVAFQSWSSTSPLSTARQSMASFGTQTAAVASTGATSGSSPYGEKNLTEEYNGTGWTSATNNPLSMQYSVGTGTETSGLVFGGNALPGPGYVATTNEYDGSSWTSGGSLGSPIGIHAGLGTQTAALQASGYGRPPSPGSNTNTAEEYNGTSWTSTNTVNTARRALSGSGIQTAGIISGGLTTTRVTNSEEYNGTSFTEGSDINTARTAFNMCGGTTESNSWIAAGTTGPGAKGTATEYYDGTSWTTQPATLAAGRSSGGGAGIQNAAVLFGGANPSISGDTEELNFSVNTITAAAWGSGGNLSTGRQRAGGFGNAQNSAVVAAGATAPPASALSATEEYNGSAWSSGGSVNTARFNMTAFGTETAGVLSGIGTPSVSYGGTTEEYNGSTWTTVNPYAAPGANYRSSCGPETAGLLAGGVAPAPAEMTNAVEEYDGTNWTSGTNLPQYQSYSNQAGTQTAAINGGGSAGPAAPGPVTANTISLEYDGTNWTTAPNANLASPTQVRSFNGGTGTQSDAMFVGGDVNLNGIRYDGTTFRTDAAYTAVRGETSAAGLAPASTATIFAGAPVPSVGNTTLEYSAEIETVTSATLTTS